MASLKYRLESLVLGLAKYFNQERPLARRGGAGSNEYSMAMSDSCLENEPPFLAFNATSPRKQTLQFSCATPEKLTWQAHAFQLRKTAITFFIPEKASFRVRRLPLDTAKVVQRKQNKNISEGFQEVYLVSNHSGEWVRFRKGRLG